MKNILNTILGMAALYGCLYVLLATITLVEFLTNMR
tara:strand:+ start:820 stop:927 length:108 start_codon:yes stop_codon:yes gene_type:complete